MKNLNKPNKQRKLNVNTLQNVYENLDVFKNYDQTYGIAARLGYKSAESAWAANPRYVIDLVNHNKLTKLAKKDWRKKVVYVNR